MHPVTVIALVTAGVIVFFFLLGKLTGGSGAELLDWDPEGHADQKVELDAEDRRQMLELANRRRRERGHGELTEEELERRVEDF